MAKSALTQLQEQIEAVRREAFAAGYEAAMAIIREVTARPALGAPGAEAPPRPRRAAAAEATPAPPPGRRRGGPRPRRGTNAHLVEEVLKAITPREARPAEIRTALRRDKGVTMAFTSIRHALSQLEARHVVEAVGDGKSWRHVG
jgi:hypothetical protein